MFLNAFFAFAKPEDEEQILDEKALESHIVKGYSRISYRQKLELCLEHKDGLFIDNNFRNRLMSRVETQNVNRLPSKRLSVILPEDLRQQSGVTIEPQKSTQFNTQKTLTANSEVDKLFSLFYISLTN